jgi:hypothetical protein
MTLGLRYMRRVSATAEERDPLQLASGRLAWVEEGKAPDTLTATRRDQGGAVTSTDDAANFVCSTGF